MRPDGRPLTTEIQLSSNIGGHNFQTVDVLAGERILAVALTNHFGVAAEYEATINGEQLPRGWEAVVPPLPPNPRPDRKALLLGVKGRVLERGETVVQPILLRVPQSAEADTKAVIQVNGVLKPPVPGKRVPIGNGLTFEVRVPKVQAGQITLSRSHLPSIYALARLSGRNPGGNGFQKGQKFRRGSARSTARPIEGTRKAGASGN